MGNVRRPLDSSRVRLEWKLEAMADAMEKSGDAAASVPQVVRQVSGLMDMAAGIRKAGHVVGLGRLAGSVASVPEKIAKSKVYSTSQRGAEAQVALEKTRHATREAAKRFHREGERFGKWDGAKQMREMIREPRKAPNRHERRRLRTV